MLPSLACGCMSLSWWAARSCFPAWLLMGHLLVAAGGWTSCLRWAQAWPQSEAAEDSPRLKMSHETDGRNGCSVFQGGFSLPILPLHPAVAAGQMRSPGGWESHWAPAEQPRQMCGRAGSVWCWAGVTH